MKRIVLASAVALAGCGEEPREDYYVMKCEQVVQAVIKSPATYVFVEGLENRPDSNARVLFDSQNVFGALTRSVAFCDFKKPFDFTLVSVSIDGEEVTIPSWLQ